ncbi:hypothetical protein ACFODZ_09600 [Marinicella sediminis]|uniref:Small CPxCG-related zinc finger protein n=1 Tax=Marinicella sediminis TaxID=1792834 RepID=A0ABV7JBD2_9GAMM|nr:hypothetical protein [Marinicella sediminis]
MNKNSPPNNNIVEVTCHKCHLNVIYLRVENAEANDSPFEPNRIICTECNQGLMQNMVNPDS